MTNVPPRLSNVVTALANRRLLRVRGLLRGASYVRVRGLLQKPPLTPWSHLRRLQARRRQGESKGKGKGKAGEYKVFLLLELMTPCEGTLVLKLELMSFFFVLLVLLELFGDISFNGIRHYYN
jgi:hypothetical protein